MSLSMQRAARPSTTPSVAEFHARLDAVLPLVESRAAEAEAQGYLTDDVVAALRKAGIYTMLFPREVGGAELLPYDAMTVIERLAYTHASAGWCAIGNNMEGTTLAIYVEDEGIKKVFAKGADITIAGNGVPRGFARPVDGGYMIRGNWAYGSGIQHAEWVHSAASSPTPPARTWCSVPTDSPRSSSPTIRGRPSS
ncbi:acyl-CoA dehydrogenase family protein [Bradyrhizobium tunisiense]|uniref:acyl-CoA dehydrogenase family protein n=1 Tax=Bradyrhizobium tunisiense TaxID=3278709 RepID=UPI0035D865BC